MNPTEAVVITLNGTKIPLTHAEIIACIYLKKTQWIPKPSLPNLSLKPFRGKYGYELHVVLYHQIWLLRTQTCIVAVTNMFTPLCAYIYTHIYMHYICTDIYDYIILYIYVYVCMYVYICVCVVNKYLLSLRNQTWRGWFNHSQCAPIGGSSATHVSPEANSWSCIMARGEFFILSECWLPGWWRNNHFEKYEEFVNGKDDIPYMKWKIKNVWNHQPAPHCSSFFFWTFMKNQAFCGSSSHILTLNLMILQCACDRFPLTLAPPKQ